MSACHGKAEICFRPANLFVGAKGERSLIDSGYEFVACDFDQHGVPFSGGKSLLNLAHGHSSIIRITFDFLSLEGVAFGGKRCPTDMSFPVK